MEKLELKHIAPYLTYGLKVKHAAKRGNIKNTTELTISDFPYLFRRAYFMPILRPLSDLNKAEFRTFEQWEYVTDNDTSSELMWDEWEYLFENHFDVFGLIEKGLAIDINTM